MRTSACTLRTMVRDGHARQELRARSGSECQASDDVDLLALHAQYATAAIR